MTYRSKPWLVHVSMEGQNIGRLVRQAGQKGIHLTALRQLHPRKVTALMREADLPVLQELAMQGGWKITPGGRHGAGRMAEGMKRRWLLVAVLGCAILALWASSQIMWQVVILDGETYAADIQAALEDMHIEPPMLRKRVDIGSIRDALEWRYPRIAWFEVGWRGTTLVVRAVEGVLPEQAQQTGPCDLIASSDGVVDSIVTKAGTPVVTPGDIVRKGDVLIKGEERSSDGTVKPVAARGSVLARVWVGSEVSIPAVEVVTTYTGRTQQTATLKTPWFDLWKMLACDYQQYDTAVSEVQLCGIFLPVVLHMETRMEAEIATQMRDLAEVQAEAEAAARRKLQEKAASGESFIDIWGNCSMIEDEKVRAYAIGEKLMEIGIRAPASGMAAPAEERLLIQPR